MPAVALRELHPGQARITAQLAEPDAERLTRSLEAGHGLRAYELA
jgi:hypothetical protein